MDVHATAPLTILLALIIATIVVAMIVFVVSKINERRNPPIGQFVTVGGMRLHYVVRGNGSETIVLLHGNTTMIQDYLTSGLADYLATKYRVILFDRPGFGYSSRPRGKSWDAASQATVIIAALAELGVPRAVLAGHSWGTMVALAMAEQKPELAKSVILLSGFYFPESRMDVMIAKPQTWPVIGDIMRYTASPITGALIMPLMLRVMFGPPPVPERFKTEFPKSLMLRPWQIRASAEDGALMVSSADNIQSGYQNLAMPVLIIAGKEDRIVDWRRQSQRLQETLSQSSIEVIDGAGHMVHHTHLDQVCRAIETHRAVAHS